MTQQRAKTNSFAILFSLAFAISGCSATEAIGTAAREAQASATAGAGKLDSADSKLGAAVSTGDVGPKAKPLVDSARADIGAAKQDFTKINDLASGIQDRVDNGEIKDTKGWFAKLIDAMLWIVGGGAVIFVLVYFSGWFKPLIQITGSFLNLIPKAIRIDAESDAKYIAEVKKVGHPASEDAIRAIELKKLDPRYRRVLDETLNGLGVPT